MCALTSFFKTICLLKISSSKGLIDTRIHLGSSDNITQTVYFYPGLFSHRNESLLFCQIVQSCLFPTSATCSDGHLMSLFFFLSPPNYNLPRKDPSSLFWSSEGTTRALGWWHSHPPSASSGLRLHGTSHAFSLTFKVPGKAVAAAVQPLPCPGPTSVLTLMQAAPRMHWDAGTWKLGLDVRRHWPWRHILTVQRGRTVWANPTLLQPLSSLFLFPDLNQCLFFFFFFSAAWYLVPCCCPYSTPLPPPAVPALHLLGTSDSTSWVCSERTLLYMTGATETLDRVGLSRHVLMPTSPT